MPAIAPAEGPPSRLRTLLELGKLRIVELWIGFFVGVTLLDGRVLHDRRALTILALILMVGVAVIAVTCSLDDIVGVRDGVDQANHRGDGRWGVSKPILAGTLSERHAFRFVHLLGGVAVLGYLAVLALAWPLPTWLLAAMPAMMLVAINYSYGLKLSYRGGGELVIFTGAAGTVLIPCALIAHGASPLLLVESLLVGSWHAQVVVFSNSHDRAGDRATGRMTIVARTSPFGNRLYIAGVFALSATLTVAALVYGAMPRAFALALAPVWALQAYQVHCGVVRQRWLQARRVGFVIIRVGVLALVAANLLLR